MFQRATTVFRTKFKIGKVTTAILVGSPNNCLIRIFHKADPFPIRFVNSPLPSTHWF